MVVTLWAISLCAVLISMPPVTNGRELLQVHLLHRHGARTEPFVSDTNLNWDYVVLSDEGAKMALALGQFLRQRYMIDMPFLPADVYDPVLVTSRTTEFERTVRTGAGVLRGLYNSSKYAIPWMTHLPPSEDHALGFYYSWPSAVLRVPYLQTFNVANNEITLQTIDQAALNLTGEILGCPTICETKPTTCALLAEDVTTCRLSNGGADPRLIEMLPQYKIIQEQSNAFLYLYNESDRYWKNTGPYGKLLADHIIANASAKLSAYEKQRAVNGSMPLTPEEAASNAVKMFHYSGHDITIYGYFVAIGAIRPVATTNMDVLVPTFTAVVIMELFSDGTIALKYGQCNQSFGSDHAYAFVENVTMGCISGVDGSTYFATECPLADFARFVATKTAADGDQSYCYADPADINRTRCNVGDGLVAPTYYDVPAPDDDIFGGSVRVEAFLPPTDDCSSYRQLCPAVACSPPYFYNMTNFACVRYVYTSAQQHAAEMDGVTPAQRGLRYFGIGLCSFAIGLVVGFVVRSFIYERLAMRNNEDAAARDSLLP